MLVLGLLPSKDASELPHDDTASYVDSDLQNRNRVHTRHWQHTFYLLLAQHSEP
jgi:hypothetical protein